MFFRCCRSHSHPKETTALSPRSKNMCWDGSKDLPCSFCNVWNNRRKLWYILVCTPAMQGDFGITAIIILRGQFNELGYKLGQHKDILLITHYTVTNLWPGTHIFCACYHCSISFQSNLGWTVAQLSKFAADVWSV